MTTDRLTEQNRAGPLTLRAPHAFQPPGGGGVPPAGPVEDAAGKLPSALSVTGEALEDLVLVALQGEFDVYTSPAFREHVRRYDPAEVQLVIDLTGVRLLDSAGLEALTSLRNDLRRSGGRLGLICPRHDLARLFWMTGLRPGFAFGEDLATVRAALEDHARRTGRGT